MKTLTACARIHPGVPSNVQVSHCKSKFGKPYSREICTVCKEHTARSMARAGGGFISSRGPSPGVREPYGVVSLNWTPPERVESL